MARTYARGKGEGGEGGYYRYYPFVAANGHRTRKAQPGSKLSTPPPLLSSGRHTTDRAELKFSPISVP